MVPITNWNDTNTHADSKLLLTAMKFCLFFSANMIKILVLIKLAYETRLFWSKRWWFVL